MGETPSLQVEVPQHEILLYFEAGKLEKVFYNLLSNAFKFTPEHGTIRVSLEEIQGEAGGAVEIIVTDTGPGIPAEEVWRRLTGPEGLGCGADVVKLAEGDAYAFTTADGDAFEGRVIRSHDAAPWLEFCGFESNHGNGGSAILRFWTQRLAGATPLWVWLSTWDTDEAAVAAIQARWDAMVDRLFPATERLAPAHGERA